MGRKTNSQIDWSLVRLVTISQVARAFLSQFLVVLAIPILLGGLLQACGGGGGGGVVTNLKSLTIEPVNSSIAAGTTLQLQATGIYKNKMHKDLTDKVTWVSANTKVASVGNAAGTKGRASAAGVGATTITVKLNGKRGASTFTVTNASLTSITIQPVSPFVAKGTTVQLAAQGHFSNGTVQDLTTQVSWSSGNTGIAQVSNASGTIGLVTGVATGNTPIAATFNAIHGSTTVTVTAAVLTSISLRVPDASIGVGTATQLTTTCNFSDGTTQDCTNQTSCTSGNTGVVQVSDASPTQKLVTGTGVGSTSVSCTFAGIQGSATETVTPATLTSITITPPDSSIPNGTQKQLTATGNFSNGTTQDLTSQVSWSSADNTIAQVSNVSGTKGLVTGLTVATTTITAFLNGIDGSTTLTITPATLTSITLTPANPSIAKGTTVQLTVTCGFSDGTTQDCTSPAHLTSSDTTIAQVGNIPGFEGLVTGVGLGFTTITAVINGMEGSVSVTVTSAILKAITITPPNPSIAKGTHKALSATGTFSDGTAQDFTSSASWTSSGPATVDPTGLVTGEDVGSATITATQAGISGSTTVTVTAAVLASITVTPPNPSLAKGTTLPLTATGTLSDGTTQILTTPLLSWTSTGSATVDPTGLVTGTSEGSGTVTAKQAGVTGSTTVTVTAAVLKAITINPPNPSIAKGTHKALTATGTFSDGTTQDFTSSASWTSTGPATVDQTGLVTGVGVGSATITATQAGIAGSTTVTVTAAVLTSITVTPPNPSIAKGTTQQLTATGTLSDGTTQILTIPSLSWTSTGSATVNPTGLVTGTSEGSGTVTATQAGVTGSTTVTVTAAVLKAITIIPADPSIAKGTHKALTATGTFSDGTTQDFTSSASWTSTGPATVDPTGLVTGVGVGSATITATQAGIAGSTTVTVTAAVLTSITVTPPNPSIAKGTTQQLTATGTLSDGTTQILTIPLLSWTSTGSATVNPTGLVTGASEGSGTVTATQAGVTGSTTVTVTAAVLTSITVTPPNPSIANGTSVQLTATGTFSDGSMQPLAAPLLSWTSTGPATVDPTGVVTGVAVGSATITATQAGVSGSTTVTVTNATFVGLIVSTAFVPGPVSPPLPGPQTIHVPLQGTLALFATAVFSDGTTQDVTQAKTCDWTSSNTDAATIISSSSSNTNGRLDASKKGGSTTITAMYTPIGGSPLTGTANIVIP